MEGMDQLALMNSRAQQGLYETMSALNVMMNSQGLQVIGQNDSFETHPYSFSGLSDIYELLMLEVSGAAGIPATKLYGRSPAGLNATGDADMQNYYDSIEEKQESDLRPVIDKLLPLMCMSEFGAVPDDLDYKFNPVRRPTEDQKKNLNQQISTAIVALYNAGIISQKISLKELRGLSDITGMWTNITDEDIERADDSFGGQGEQAPGGLFGRQNAAAPVSRTVDGGTQNGYNSFTTDEDKWLSTEEGNHFMIGEGGEIKVGFGGKFTGKKLSEIFGKAKAGSNQKSSQSLSSPKEENSAQSQTSSTSKNNVAASGADEIFNIKNVSKKDLKTIEGIRGGYVGSAASWEINSALRTGTVSDRPLHGDVTQRQVVEALDRNMKPLGRDVTVYRAIDEDDPLFKTKPGEIYTNKGYTSTSESDTVRKSWERPGLVEIRVPKSTNVYVPKEEWQHEIVLHRDVQIKVISRKRTKDGVNIVAELVE